MKRFKNSNSRETVVVALILVIGIGVFLLSSNFLFSDRPKNGISSTSSNTTSSGAATGLLPPAIPSNGAYLGAWVNPLKLADSGEAGSRQISQLSAFNTAIGRPPPVLLTYSGFADPLPTATLSSIVQNGSIPLLSWECANVDDVASGKDDAIITAYAQSIISFGKPLFLRWYWEMNHDNGPRSACNGYQNGPGYIAAWQHIWTIFHKVGATNAAFVWAPSEGSDQATYYPGDQYVDWIAVDSYDHLKNNDPRIFATKFLPFYQQWSSHGKPLMISETGAMSDNQVNYLEQIAQDLPSQFPDIKALMHFDSAGNLGDWSLQAPGLAEFKTIEAMPYFSPKS